MAQIIMSLTDSSILGVVQHNHRMNITDFKVGDFNNGGVLSMFGIPETHGGRSITIRLFQYLPRDIPVL